MEIKRYFLSFMLIFATTCSFSNQNQPNIGIALVHGTNDHRKDAEGDYWKMEFINSLTSALPNPENRFPIACNFSEYMWDEEAAGCAANQILGFIRDKKIDKLIVYTHSNGGNVIRWILSNPTYDARFLKLQQVITKVVALSPSSGGTPLADEAIDGNVFEESVGWLVGYRNNSVRQQRVNDMAIYNKEVLLGTPGRPSLPVPFEVVVSSDVTASPFTSASYCNGYFLNAGLKVTKLYLDACADGFINCTSQSVAGNVWFFDIDKLNDNTPLSHNQSRHSCFGLDQILSQDLSQQGVL